MNTGSTHHLHHNPSAPTKNGLPTSILSTVTNQHSSHVSTHRTLTLSAQYCHVHVGPQMCMFEDKGLPARSCKTCLEEKGAHFKQRESITELHLPAVCSVQAHVRLFLTVRNEPSKLNTSNMSEHHLCCSDHMHGITVLITGLFNVSPISSSDVSSVSPLCEYNLMLGNTERRLIFSLFCGSHDP